MPKVSGDAIYYDDNLRGPKLILAVRTEKSTEHYFIDDGNFLTLYNEDGSIAFRGVIRTDYKNGFGCLWTQRGYDLETWLALFQREKPLRGELFYFNPG